MTHSENTRKANQESSNENLHSKLLIVFDWDGTLIDSHDYIIDSMQLAAKHYPVNGLSKVSIKVPSRAEVSAIIGKSMDPAIEILFPSLSAAQREEFKNLYTEFYNDSTRQQPILFDGVFEGLQQLKHKSYTLAIATGKRMPGLLSGLQETNSKAFFTALRTADNYASKPSPDMLASLLTELDVAAEDCVMVGDNVVDIQMAEALSVLSVGLTTGSSTAADMQAAGARYCFERFSDMLALF